MLEDKISSYTRILFWIVGLLLLLPWLIVQYNTAINPDTSWLTMCAARIMDGGNMLNDCMDSNPPLSILIYTPFVWLSRITAIPVYHILFSLTFALALLSTGTTRYLLGFIKPLTPAEKDIFTLSFLYIITVIPSILFTERDHFLAMAIIPLFLSQIAITYRHDLPRPLLLGTLIICGPFLLLKPHFGLIPAFLLIHRMIYQKRIWIMRDMDFIVLFLITLGYIAIAQVYFKDFVTIILPDILDLYLPFHKTAETWEKAIPCLEILALVAAALMIVKKENRAFYNLIWGCAALCLCAFIIQMKGLSYQLLPFYAFIFPISALLLFNLIKRGLSVTSDSLAIKLLPMIFSILICSVSYIAADTLNPLYPTHKQYMNNPIENYLDEHCRDTQCPFYITHKTMGIINQLGFYSKHVYATRFPGTCWSLPGTLLKKSEKEKDEIIKRYAIYTAQDVERFSPPLLFLYTPDENNPVDYAPLADILFEQPELAAIMSGYKKIDTLKVDSAYFYKHNKNGSPYVLTWDVYKRIVPNQ
jgi:hypothetical protein